MFFFWGGVPLGIGREVYIHILLCLFSIQKEEHIEVILEPKTAFIRESFPLT